MMIVQWKIYAVETTHDTIYIHTCVVEEDVDDLDELAAVDKVVVFDSACK